MDEQVEEIAEAEHDASLPKPLQGRRVWFILSAILVVIAVAVLYVYQAGDRKTVLGNQPIPAGQAMMPPTQVALNAPPAAGALNVPVGGGMLPAPGGPAGSPGAMPPAVNQTASTSVVQCPVCHSTGLPICSSCGAVMQALNGTELFVCPSCGSAGVPLCASCGAHMQALSQAGAPAAGGYQAPAAQVGGQFQCPACKATGLPNWNANGVPHCPNCNAVMGVR